jgi:pimeloyl-ACP methyl ester carboxylesterase
MPAIRHRNITIDGRRVFLREAGDPARPTLVLLPGFPSSSRAYVRLIGRLAHKWHAAFGRVIGLLWFRQRRRSEHATVWGDLSANNP